jgi:hypothetical protein
MTFQGGTIPDPDPSQRRILTEAEADHLEETVIRARLAASKAAAEEDP